MAYKLKITIKHLEPEIWRRVKIPGGITFQALHHIIQASFDWTESHLFKFDFPDVVITTPFGDLEPSGLFGKNVKELDPYDTTIDEYLDKYDEFEYEYDFGDSWIHKIVVERKLKETRKNSIPVCVGGAMERPPEDVGGIGGYVDFIRIITDKKHPDRQEMLDWAEKDTRGRIYDPEYFNKNEVDRRLYYALENDEFDALDLFAGEGLTGKVHWGGSDTCIKTYGKDYSMQQIGDMLLRIGTGSIVTIKVDPVERRY